MGIEPARQGIAGREIFSAQTAHSQIKSLPFVEQDCYTLWLTTQHWFTFT